MPTIFRRAPYRPRRRRVLLSAAAGVVLHDGLIVATAPEATAVVLGASTGVAYTATASATAPAATATALGAVTQPAYSATVQASAPAATASALGSRAASLRFYGTGSGQIDRVRIPLTQASGTQSRPVNVGAGDFTIEVWLKAAYADNTSYTPFSDARNSNIFLDRDIWNDSRGWVAGVRRVSGTLRACFGVAGGGSWTTITGSADVGDDAWHHIAIVRRQSTGVVELYVDGTLDASGTYTTGDLSYPLSYTPTGGTNNEYLVIGAEKHDAGSEYPSFNGTISELRISDTRRYTTTFTRPSAPFAPDANAVGLYHSDSAPGAILRDAATVSGAPTNGELLIGGANNAPVWSPLSPFSTIAHAGSMTATAPAATATALGGSTVPAYAGVLTATAPAASASALGSVTIPAYAALAAATAPTPSATALGAVTQPSYAATIAATADPATATMLGASGAAGAHTGLIQATAPSASAQALGASTVPVYAGATQAQAPAATGSALGAVGAGNVYLGQVLAVQSAALVDVWMLNEASGTTALAFKNSAHNATYRASVTPGTSWPTAYGETQFVAPGLFPTTGDISFPAAALASKINWSEGACAVWIRTTAAGWDEATLRRPILIQVDANNRIMLYRNAGADTLQAYYIGGGVTRSFTVSNVTQRSGVGWLHALLTWSIAGDYLRLYLNDELAGSVSGLTVASGTLALFLLAGNPYFPNSTYAVTALWTTPLSQSDAQALVSPVVRDRLIILEGDSLTVGGQAGATPYPKTLARNLPWEIDQRTIAASGEKLSQMITDYAAQAEARYRPASAHRNVLVILGGTNDIQNESVATAYSRLQTYWALARATGYWVVAVTLPAGNPSGSVNPYNSYRNSLNTLILSDPSLYDAIARPDLNPNIGQDGDEANGTYFNADQLHLTTAGYTELATEVRAALLATVATATASAPAAQAQVIGSAASPVYDGFVLTQAPIAVASAVGASSGAGAYLSVVMAIAPAATAHASGVFASMYFAARLYRAPAEPTIYRAPAEPTIYRPEE